MTSGPSRCCRDWLHQLSLQSIQLNCWHAFSICATDWPLAACMSSALRCASHQPLRHQTKGAEDTADTTDHGLAPCVAALQGCAKQCMLLSVRCFLLAVLVSVQSYTPHGCCALQDSTDARVVKVSFSSWHIDCMRLWYMVMA